MATDPAETCPREILFVGYGDWHLWSWDGFRTRSAQICRFLSRSNRIANVYVLNEPIYLRHLQPGFAVPRSERFRALPLRGGVQRAEDKIHLVDPSRFLVGPDALKRGYTVRLVRRSLQKLSRPPILWIANVHKAYLMDEIEGSIKIFDAIDDWESISVYGRLEHRIRAGYETIMEKADVIYTVSSHLRNKFLERANTPHVMHLPNGVDPNLFQVPADPPRVRREKRGGREPVLTCVGVLSERTDLDLIERLVRDWPACRIRLVGPMTRSVEQWWRERGPARNLEWRGLVHHSKVPDILRASDVLLIPHKESPLSRSMDPLKMYEYLTTGLPIVSTPVPPTEDFPSLIYVGTGKEFSEQVGVALNEAGRPDAEERWRARVEESREHHWDRRIARIESDMMEQLGAVDGL
jgi:hypothetical protein